MFYRRFKILIYRNNYFVDRILTAFTSLAIGGPRMTGDGGQSRGVVRRETYVRTEMVVVVLVPTECIELNRETQIILLVNLSVPLDNFGFLVLNSTR